MCFIKFIIDFNLFVMNSGVFKSILRLCEFVFFKKKSCFLHKYKYIFDRRIEPNSCSHYCVAVVINNM